MNGINKVYYISGDLKFEAIYKDDKLNGVTKLYYESGELQAESIFKDNKIFTVSIPSYTDRYNIEVDL